MFYVPVVSLTYNLKILRLGSWATLDTLAPGPAIVCKSLRGKSRGLALPWSFTFRPRPATTTRTLSTNSVPLAGEDHTRARFRAPKAGVV